MNNEKPLTKNELLEALKPFATKADFNEFATKDDLVHFATKDTLIKELQMVRNEFKDELFKTRIALENKIDSVHEELESDINRLAKMCAQEFLITQNNERRIGILEKNVLV